eukprot:TRINITY_DN20801_c0_g3_i1.p1 TRINITY_DN20801_c0_g3~~TRINITY_DN20801_c0_g3_i1.p1  ORF type:complete len:725 (+),score=151.19 TRINITY_DN20801_c0_g3_i1:59-2233(+)
MGQVSSRGGALCATTHHSKEFTEFDVGEQPTIGVDMQGGDGGVQATEAVEARGLHNVQVQQVSSDDLQEVLDSHAQRVSMADLDILDLEDVRWTRWFVKHFWPHFGNMMARIVKERIEPQFDRELEKFGVAGKPFKGIKFTKFNLGNQLPEIGPVKAYRKSHQDYFGIEVDCEVHLDCEPEIELLVPLGNVTLGIRKLYFSSMVSIIMKPFTDQIPIVGGLSCFLLNRPKMDFEFLGTMSNANGSILHRVIRNIVLEQISKVLVLPNRMHINLIKEWQLGIDLVTLRCPRPEGIMVVRALSAENLMAGDVSVSEMFERAKSMLAWRTAEGGSEAADPYCTVRVGSQTLRTPTVQNTTKPVWPKEGSVGEFFVYNLRQECFVEVVDDDFGFTSNDVLAKSEDLIVGDLLSKPEHELTLVEEGKPKGAPPATVKLAVQYFSLGRAESIEDFTGHTERHDCPSQALLAVQIHGIRPIGHGQIIGDAVGMTIRCHHRSQSGEILATSTTKPARLRSTNVQLDGVDPTSAKFVRNLRAMQPHLSNEDIARLAEVQVSTVESILDMHELMPLSFDVGIYHFVQDVHTDVCVLELMSAKRGFTKPEVVSVLEMPMADLLNAPDYKSSGSYTFDEMAGNGASSAAASSGRRISGSAANGSRGSGFFSRMVTGSFVTSGDAKKAEDTKAASGSNLQEPVAPNPLFEVFLRYELLAMSPSSRREGFAYTNRKEA